MYVIPFSFWFGKRTDKCCTTWCNIEVWKCSRAVYTFAGCCIVCLLQNKKPCNFSYRREHQPEILYVCVDCKTLNHPLLSGLKPWQAGTSTIFSAFLAEVTKWSAMRSNVWTFVYSCRLINSTCLLLPVIQIPCSKMLMFKFLFFYYCYFSVGKLSKATFNHLWFNIWIEFAVMISFI